MSRMFSFLSRWCLGALVLLGVMLCQSHCLPVPDPREKIEQLRVLGIKADPPAAKPGDTVALSALTVVPTQDTMTLAWFLCTSPTDVEQGCHEQTSAQSLGSADTAMLTVPSQYLQGELTAAEKQQGRYLIVTLVAKAGMQTFIATKRIVVTDKPNNRNPSIDKLSLQAEDGSTQTEPWQVKPEKTYPLAVTVPDQAQESYTYTNTAGVPEQTKEKLYLSWYLTDGSYKKGYLGAANDLANFLITPKEVPASGTITLYVILRDGRGGVDWKTSTVRIQP